MSDDYYAAINKCAQRYETMTVKNNWDHDADLELVEFIEEFRQGIYDKLPLMKLNRWLGYIQGCLIERGATTVDDERDWTRPLFRPLDFV